jgi:hypothetical protein
VRSRVRPIPDRVARFPPISRLVGMTEFIAP